MAMPRIANFGVRRVTRRRQSARNREHVGADRLRAISRSDADVRTESRREPQDTSGTATCQFIPTLLSTIPHLRRNSPIYFAALPGSTTIVAVMRGCSEQKYS